MRLMRSILAGGLALVAACGSSTSPSGGGTNPPPAANVTAVSIQDFSFFPSTLTIKAGTTVRWTNNGPTTHTTTSDAAVWDSGNLAGPTPGGPYGGGSPGATYDVPFTKAGTYAYHCALHPPSSYPTFKGSITVTP